MCVVAKYEYLSSNHSYKGVDLLLALCLHWPAYTYDCTALNMSRLVCEITKTLKGMRNITFTPVSASDFMCFFFSYAASIQLDYKQSRAVSPKINRLCRKCDCNKCIDLPGKMSYKHHLHLVTETKIIHSEMFSVHTRFFGI